MLSRPAVTPTRAAAPARSSSAPGPGEADFLSFSAICSLFCVLLSLRRPPTSLPLGSGRARSVALPLGGGIGWDPTNHSPLPRHRGTWGELIWGGLYCTLRCVKPLHCCGVPAPRPARNAQLRGGLSSSHPHSAPLVFLNDRRWEDTSDRGGSGCH